MYRRTGDVPLRGLEWSLLGRAILLLVAIALTVLIAPSGRADPTSAPGETAEGVFGEGTTGHGQPDSKTGAMTWTYPFNLPAARGRPQPRLALSYNSSSRDREAGYGWGLDLPVIERKPLSGNPCFTPNGTPITCGERFDATGKPLGSAELRSEERYTYNGQPLVFICQLPGSQRYNDPDCGDERQPGKPINKGWRYFRLQVEGQFSRFYLSEDRRYWRVQLKGGELLEFGEPPNSGTAGIEHAFGNENAVLRWRLFRHSDAVHKVSGAPANYIDYRWKRLGKRGLLYLTDIYDTPRANGPHSDLDFAHHTQLTWQSPDFPQTFYADPYRATPDLRLTRVAVASMPWSGIGPREVIRTYHLGYAAAQGTEPIVPTETKLLRFQLWHHSFLSGILMEGRCGQFEDDQGNIPPDRSCPQSRSPESIAFLNSFPEELLPPTTFEYEGANSISFGAAFITKVEGGPPNAVDENRVLPYVNSVGVVDFNRDGLPDIVQSWDAEFCPNEVKNEDAIHETIRIARNIRAIEDNNFIYCDFRNFGSYGEVDEVIPKPILSSRPIIGYLNRGLDNVYVRLAYQCMDAGRIDDITGLTYHNAGRAPGFFTNKGATTLLGSWGEGIVAWSNAQYAPYRARPLLRSSKPGEVGPGSDCDAAHFTKDDFRPGWEWEQTQDVDWAKHPPNEKPDPSRQPRWFTDIDGDGLTDRLESSGEQLLDFEAAYVEFTQRYAKNYPRQGSDPAQIPFVFDFNQAGPHSLAPSVEGGKRGTKFYYVDINGDGLVDLVTYNQNDSGGVPRVRPGNGHGEFACIDSQQPWPCQKLPTEVARVYEIEASGSRMPWPFDEETFFHDVTADGLADIVQYDMSTGKVRLWVNQDGHTFACVTGSTGLPCVAGVVVDERTGTLNIGNHRTTFADMNADGTDDIVILAKQGAYVGMFMYNHVPIGYRGWAPRPGLLRRIHNGYGATTDIQYHTIQQLDLAAKDTTAAWQYHSPVVENVVTQVITQDSYSAGDNNIPVKEPYLFKRKAQYFYQNPAYDRWARSFAGFRKVFAHYGDEVATTATTYWFGPCENNELRVPLPENADPQKAEHKTDIPQKAEQKTDIPPCQKGSDDDDYKSITGRVVRIDRGTAFLKDFFNQSAWLRRGEGEGPRLLWTKTFGYISSNPPLFDRPDRRVMFSYPTDIDTYLYDDAQPTQPAGENPFVKGGDPLENAPYQKGVRKHLKRVVEYDNRGTLRRVTDHGAVEEEESDVADATTITLFSPERRFWEADGPSGPDGTPAPLPCTSDWQCLPGYVSIWEPQSDRLGKLPAKLLRKSHFTYTATGDVQSVEGWLESPSKPLERHHPAGDTSTAPKPAGQSLDRGWHTFATLSYDTWGNVTQTAGGQSPGGSPPRCTAIAYDTPYQYLPNVVRNFKDGCGGAALETQSIFDRGFEQVVSSIAPNGGSSEIRYDRFGRPIEVCLPNPDDTSGTQASAPAAIIAYSDRKPVSHIDVRRVVGPFTTTRSVTISNGLGEPVVAFDQGDNNDWILNGWRETNATGQVEKVRRPWTFSGDPIAAALKGHTFPVPSDNSSFEIRYDGFGRKVSIKENGAGFSQELMRNSYFPLAIETRDAEQLKPKGPHEKAFQRVEFDGHGRNTRAVEHIGNPTTDNIVTTVQYNPTGEPVTITRRDDAGSTYQRTMEFDMLGRLMVNKEPNTGNNWRYVWDDAGRLVGTSDARGCGVNFHYDGIGRLLGEDYSPCLASQPAYTSPNPATGEGLETFYRYDAYEAGQVSPEPSFTDDPRSALGSLVAVRDRGSHTRFNYDVRDRVRRISRQVAKPDGLGTGSPYAPHWFTSRLDYDLGDRLIRRTTGVEVVELLMKGASEERYAYSPRGQIFGIDSSYGAIVKSLSYDPDGAPNRIVYGDVSGTTANFEYDARRRLTRYHLLIPYSFPNFLLDHFDYGFSSYDEVGNPLVIEDRPFSSFWSPLPPHAAPVQKRKMEYDDLYRLTRVDNTYTGTNGTAPWRSPFEVEIAAGDRHPVPLRELPTRVTQQTFDYDWLGNLTASSDDLSARYDRSLGPNLEYGKRDNGPNQLRSGEGLQVRYDESGNLAELKIERPGNCPTGAANQCAQWFAYDWDEVGQLARARRWDFDGNALPVQASPETLRAKKPSWDLTYAYSQGARVRKSVADAADIARHTLEVFDTLRVEQTPFDSTGGDYKVKYDNVHAYPGGMAHVFWDTDGQLPHQAPDSLITMHLVMGDHLGSSSVIINHASSELVERTTYQPYGAVESDYRPSKGKALREPYKFTGKEEDIEVGATYFGARYYQPYLGRFMSADPLTIHGLGSDLNPYAYVGGRVMTHIDPLGLCGGGYPIEGGSVTYEYDCSQQSRDNAESKAARGEAAASQATAQPTQATTQPTQPTQATNVVLGKGPVDTGALVETGLRIAKSPGMKLAGKTIGRTVARRAAERAARKAGKNLADKTVQARIARSAVTGAKTGGIVGWALHLATSPGGDTVLAVPVYQTSRTDQLVVPGADWHANRADAENDARAYSAATGIPTTVEESNTKSIGGLLNEGTSDPALATEILRSKGPGRPLEAHGSWLYDPASGEEMWDPWWFLH